ncbi:MAG: nucleotide exchange factor GrpE [Bacteroidales bacterium]
MTKKKHESAEEVKREEAAETAENMNINSQETNDGAGNETTAANQADGPGQSDQGSTTGAVADKEPINEPSSLEKLAEMQDRYLRLSAEFDNYRKRTLREKIELTKHAGENILIGIVPVMDDFERAMKLMDSTNDCAAMKSGIDLIYNKFRDFLKQNGIKEIESLNTDFNVDLHEAVSKIKVEDENLKGKVVEVIQKGYFLHEKVMRFSKVVVGE